MNSYKRLVLKIWDNRFLNGEEIPRKAISRDLDVSDVLQVGKTTIMDDLSYLKIDGKRPENANEFFKKEVLITSIDTDSEVCFSIGDYKGTNSWLCFRSNKD